MKKILDWKKYEEISAKTVAEGIVMLKNDNNALPISKIEEVSVFGRIQLDYYKSGTGSGGMVNVSHVVGITEGLLNAGANVNKNLLAIYEEWESHNPFDYGVGWGTEPWSQKEMPLEKDIVLDAAKTSDTALVIIGRTAGEEMDNRIEKGAFLLSDEEENMLKLVRDAFKKVVVLLNVGGLFDMSFMDKYSPDSVLYVWHGGMVGGTGTADVLLGNVSPSGKLPDTIAYNVSDYPSDKYFGDTKSNCYVEDIYVGYRYFETFAKDKVRFPFGFGISYSKFEPTVKSFVYDEKKLTATIIIEVTNIGLYNGKEVVQVYLSAPQGLLGKAARELCGFEKTTVLAPSEKQTIEISVNLSDFSSYDDSGVTGNRFCRLLEQGEYNFYVGSDVRSAVLAGSVKLAETIVIERCRQALAPFTSFERMKNNDGTLEFEDVPLNEADEKQRRMNAVPDEITYTGDKGIKLSDVLNGKYSMSEFIAQFSDYDLSCIIRGEGMGSPKVTAGTASAFGGVTDSLKAFEIPCICCSDGPSGMRFDCGTKAFSLPNGTLIASTFNKELATELFSYMGLEMTANNVDCLLGPGMNIHRHPLNGRNFEYLSEDPFLTGTMAAAELCGMESAGVTGTIKHFCGNNQETNRHFIDSVVSERALREIYLRGFEIAIKQGGAKTIMTTYGKVNGLWTAGSYDLNTVILRDEWKFDGVSMTDWWANINRRGGKPDKDDFSAMAMAQNDLYMVCADSAEHNDTTLSDLEKGILKRSELQRNAANICRFAMTTHAMKRLLGCDDTTEVINVPKSDDNVDNEDVKSYELNGSIEIDLTGISSKKGGNYSFVVFPEKPAYYNVTITADNNLSELSQVSLTIYAVGIASGTYTWNGTSGNEVAITREVGLSSHFTNIRLYFAQNGLNLHKIKFEYSRDINDVGHLKKED